MIRFPCLSGRWLRCSLWLVSEGSCLAWICFFGFCKQCSPAVSHVCRTGGMRAAETACQPAEDILREGLQVICLALHKLIGPVHSLESLCGPSVWMPALRLQLCIHSKWQCIQCLAIPVHAVVEGVLNKLLRQLHVGLSTSLL